MRSLASEERQACEAAKADALTASGAPSRAFLRARWYSACGSADRNTFMAEDAMGNPLAAFSLVDRRKGPLALREVGGCYWPFRGVPIAPQASVQDLTQALLKHKAALGRIWRLGPVEADCEALCTLTQAASAAGWHVLRRPLGKVFELDLDCLTRGGAWPSSKTQRKNRWRKRRLEEDGGEIRTEFFSGADWTPEQRNAMASIEAASWLGKLADGGDTKFRDSAMRQYWEQLCDDPALGAMLFGSVMWIGDTPAAFTFGIEAGDVRYYIANNFDERFTHYGPGRVLLYDDFARAADQGVTKISWGLGDAGYKTEMGAKSGSEMQDLLFVRGRMLAALVDPWWKRPA